MNVLVLCECSQVVCRAFRESGHIAYSCDIDLCYGGHPEWHIVGDALLTAHADCLVCEDGSVHDAPLVWDLIIAHPPCTYLCKSQWLRYDVKKFGYEKVHYRELKRDQAIKFFKDCLALYPVRCDRLCVENPYGTINKWVEPSSQCVHPWQFGDQATKPTHLWLRDLPLLTPTNVVEVPLYRTPDGYMASKWWCDSYNIQDYGLRSRYRSQTFPGIACAMVDQWGSL